MLMRPSFQTCLFVASIIGLLLFVCSAGNVGSFRKSSMLPVASCPVCPVCGDLTGVAFPQERCSFSKRVSTRSIPGATFEASVQKCLNCGHIHLWPILTNEQLSDLYANRYANQAPSAMALARAASQWRFFQRHLPLNLSRPLTVVELGCSHGHLLARFSPLSKLICYEPDPDHSAAALKQRSQNVMLVRSVVVGEEIRDNSVDFWLGSHSLEHIADPHLLFQAAQRKIVRGGFMFQEFPTSQGDETYPERDPIANLHLNWFSQSSITLLASRYGFVPMGLQYAEGTQGVPNGDLGDALFSRYLRGRVIRMLFQLVQRDGGLPPRK